MVMSNSPSPMTTSNPLPHRSPPPLCGVLRAQPWHPGLARWQPLAGPLRRAAAAHAATGHPRRGPGRTERLTAAPRRYGWHATLKAPFALAPGVDWLTLHHAVQTLADSLQPFSMPPLQVERIDDFLALVPLAAHPANAKIQAAAAACVTQPQPLAAPLSEGDPARRRAAGLTPAGCTAAAVGLPLRAGGVPLPHVADRLARGCG